MHNFHVFLACQASVIRADLPDEHAALRHVIDKRHLASDRAELNGASLIYVTSNAFKRDEGGKDKLSAWFPAASSDQARQYLWNRISSECNALSVHTALALSLLSQLYPTSSVGMQLHGHAVTDFGLAFGFAPVLPNNRVAYLRDGDMTLGQDPSRHTWLYFTNAVGQTATLDLCMASMNCGLLVSTAGFRAGLDRDVPAFVPAVWRPLDDKKFYLESGRVSVMRDAQLARVASIISLALSTTTTLNGVKYDVSMAKEINSRFGEWVSLVTKHKMPEDMVVKLLRWATVCAFQLRGVVRDDLWHRWPREWEGEVDYDPDEDNKCVQLAKEFMAHKRERR